MALVAAFGAAAAPPVPAPAAAPPAEPSAPAKKDKSIQMDKSSPRAPDAALLDYIGRYGDAAIGLDPLGLAPGGAGAGPDQEPR